MNRGKMMTPTRVSRHSSEIMTTRVLIREMTLVIRLTNVPVTARCAPLTSLFRRDIISPGLGVGEKAHAHALHVGIERLAQIADDAFAHGRTQIALRDLHQPGRHGQAKEAQGQPVQPRSVPVGQGVVQQVAKEQRRDQAQQRGQNDQGDQQQCFAPVGAP